MRSTAILLLSALLVACTAGDPDFDGDGVLDADDCDPNNNACLLGTAP